MTSAIGLEAESQWDGLFAPDSVTWRVHSEPVLWVAGLRALLLQALHPVGVTGVFTHSDFRADPWGRLMRTANYVGTVNFGTRAEVDAIGAHVRRLHSSVKGIDPETKTRYSATDPELLLWVHCCEIESFLNIYQRARGLSKADADAYLDEQRRAAEVVGLDPATVPGSVGAMASYFSSMRSKLLVDDRTREVARLILVPPMPARVQALTPARPAWSLAAVLAVTSMPKWARRLYGLPALPTTDLATTLGLRSLALSLQALPQKWRDGPHLSAARDRLNPS